MIGNLAKKRKEEHNILLAEICKKEESIAQLKQKDNNLMLKITKLQHSVNLKENEYETLKSNVKSLDDKIRYMVSKSNASLEKMNSTTALRSLCNI